MINKDMTVGEVLRSCSDAAMDAVVKIFTDMGMHCLFCPHSTAETLEEAAEAIKEIIARAYSDPDSVKAAPQTTPIGRPDEVKAARTPKLRD